MAKLESVTVSELREALGGVDGAKAAQRLMVAIAYKDGVDVATLSDRYGFPDSTIYYWLDRLESDPLEDAVADDPRPGRPPKLTPSQRSTVANWLSESPTEHGFERADWTAHLLRDQIRAAFGVEYSRGHARRLLRVLDYKE